MNGFAELATLIRARPPRLGRTRLVAIDGPSGAGKTRFATQLARVLDAPVVHTDDLLNGWEDQFTFWDRLEALVLGPLRRGQRATYRPYRWDTRGFTGEPLTVRPAAVVLLDGVSSARAVIRPELSLAVFVTAPAELRRTRSTARDGDPSVAYAAYLERWRAAEDRHFVADETAKHADLIVDGSAEGDPDEYFRMWRRPPERARIEAVSSEDGVGR